VELPGIARSLLEDASKGEEFKMLKMTVFLIILEATEGAEIKCKSLTRNEDGILYTQLQ
jgi:hypothetical protein